MRIILLLSCVALLNDYISAQDYFQQKVDYKMDVELLPSENMISADAVIHYQNNSKTTLNNIFFHLWSNAYANNATALAQQMLRQNNTKMHFANFEDIGGYENIEFTQDGQVLNFYDYQNQVDVIQLELFQPIAPGESIEIQCTFKIKIPIFFSRMGREDNFFQITQWYPKPAVLDRDGWHPMPYLDLGEFYSEFGDYEVNITTPKEFAVAATGLTKKMINTDDEKVQYTFLAEKVHDFAWVACDHFTTSTDEITLDNGETISLRVHRINEVDTWDQSLQYLKEAVQFYSEEVAPYPYPQATVVQSPGGTGGGMEYPMLTTIDIDNSAKDVDHVIAHEVGHNWFYGILATNEREQAWMDEGMNSYFDHKYTDSKYESGLIAGLPKFINSGSDQTLLETTCVWQCKRGRNQACNTHSNSFNSINYGLSAYEIPALSFAYLNNYLGEEVFSKCIDAYYENWKFKHPKKEDLIEVFETTSGESLDWFFDGLLFQDGYLDYKLKKIDVVDDKINVHLSNKGTIQIPVRLDMMTEDTWEDHVWVPAFQKDTIIQIDQKSYDYLKINGAHPFIDVHPENNGKYITGNIKSILPDIKLLTRLDNPEQRELYLMPFWGWNHYDRNYLGISLFNSTLPQKWFRFNANVAYAFRTKSIVGTAKIEKDFLLSSDRFRKVTLHVDAKRFNYDENNSFFSTLNYYKVKPGISLFLTPDLVNRKESILSYHFHYLNKQIFIDFQEDTKERNGNIFHELTYEFSKGHGINSYGIKVGLLQHNYEVQLDEIEKNNFLKLTAEFQGKYKYHKKAKFHYRVFAGYFPINTQRYSNSFNQEFTKGSLNLSYGPSADVTFDQYYFGRTSQTHWTEKQLHYREGGFKTPLIYNQGSLGKSNHGAIAINLKTDIPIPLFKVIPIKPYLDMGYYAAPEDVLEEKLEWRFLVDAGLAFEFLDGAIGIYLPLIQSKEIDIIYDDQSSFMRRVSFQFNIQKLKPWDFIDRFDM